jgi:hypothetical protein
MWVSRRTKKLLGIHSPTAHILGTCWCQKDLPLKDLTDEDIMALAKIIYERSSLFEGIEENDETQNHLDDAGHDVQGET